MVFRRELADDCSMSQNSSFGPSPDDPDRIGNDQGVPSPDSTNAWATPGSSQYFRDGQYSTGSQSYGDGYGYADPVAGSGELSVSDDKTFAILAALSIPVGLLVSLGWLGFAGPLIIWLIYRDRSPFVRTAAARAFNFQLGMTIASIIAWLLLFTVILIPVSIIIWVAVFILSLYYPIRATIEASNYRLFSYPFSLSVID